MLPLRNPLESPFLHIENLRKKLKNVTNRIYGMRMSMRWIFKLLPQECLKQAVLNAIKGLPCLLDECGQTDPDQNGASDVIALNFGLSTLAAFDFRELFGLAMKLLDLSA